MKPTRKPNRLEHYDYSQSGVYFLTFCTNERKQILSRIDTAADLFSLPIVRLTETGRIVGAAIENISERYPGVSVDRFVIMPNHVHLLLRIEPCGRFDNRPYYCVTVKSSQVTQSGVYYSQTDRGGYTK